MKTWRTDHDPARIPNGCNGKPGDSGRNRHRRANEPVCAKCREAANHAKRERNRGQPRPRRPHPCGTPAAARRHRRNGQPLDMACRAAEANHHAQLRAQHHESRPKPGGFFIGERK